MKTNHIIIFTLALALCSCTENAELTWKKDAGTDMPAWRGERKSLCAELKSEVDLKDVSLEVSCLKSGKAMIHSTDIKAQFVSYVIGDVLDTTRFSQCGYRPAGAYDSLYVADMLDIDKVRDVPAGLVQPLWITIAVPQDAEPGIYKGTFTVSGKGAGKMKLPIEIEVAQETLPEPKDWAFHLDLWQNPYSVARFHNVEPWSEEHFEAMRPVMKLLADAGQKVVTATILDKPWNGQTEDAFGSMVVKKKYADGHWEYDFSIFDKWVEFMAEVGIDQQINCYSMIPWKTEYDYIEGETGIAKSWKATPGKPEYAEYWGSFVKAFAAHLREKGWFEKTMISMDERALDDMLAALRVIKGMEPDFKVALAGNYHPELKYLLDDYCVALQQEFPQDVREMRDELGLVSTYYTCCAEAHPNTFIASDPLEAVWIPWGALARNDCGYLRWAYNSWTINPLEDARFRTWPAGDCYIVYPEGRSSIRFEKLVEGIQDYEKARILKARWTETGDTARLGALNEALKAFTLENLLKNGPADALATAKQAIR